MSLWHYALAFLLFAHGVAHVVGFLVPWRLIPESRSWAYKTTLLGGLVDVGDTGIRVVGVLYLVALAGFAVAAVAVATTQPWWWLLTLVVTVYSLLMTVLGWPEARIGVFLNVAIVAALLLWSRLVGGAYTADDVAVNRNCGVVAVPVPPSPRVDCSDLGVPHCSELIFHLSS